MKKAIEWLTGHPLVFCHAFVVVMAAIIINGLFSMPGETEEEEDVGRLGKGIKVVHTPKNRRTLEREAAKADRRKARAERRVRKAERKVEDDEPNDSGEFDNFHGNDRTLAKRMNDRFWDDDMEGVFEAAREAANSKDPALREMAIEKLAWFDVDGMADLLPFLVDPDEKIASKAVAAWTDALTKIDDDNERATLVREMSKVYRNESGIQSMLITTGNMSDIAAMQILVDVIDVGTDEAAAAAKDYYEFVTGEEFTDIDAAEEWLYEHGDIQEEINAQDEGDVDRIAAAAGMTREQYWERLEKAAADENMSMEDFVDALKESAQEEGKSLTDYLVDRETEIREAMQGGVEDEE